MKIKIEIQCECGNQDTVEIKKGKEFRDYDIFTVEFAIKESISESGKFKGYQTHLEGVYISCNKCDAEIEVML